MQMVIALLKSLLIGLLLLLLLGSGACVFIDISLLLGSFGTGGVSSHLEIVLMTMLAAALAFGAGYGIYALMRSFRRTGSEADR